MPPGIRVVTAVRRSVDNHFHLRLHQQRRSSVSRRSDVGVVGDIVLTSVNRVGAVKKAAGKLTRNQGLVPRGEAGKVRNKAVTVTNRLARLH